MQRAVARLSIKPNLILVDGNRCPIFDCEARAIVGGDALEASISAASIVAKVLRDRYMHLLDRYHPHYGFAKHKGYGTEAHLDALQTHGVSRIHRLTFAPVTKLISTQG
jgi:ribonuclease HII